MTGSDQPEWDATFVVDVLIINQLLREAIRAGSLALPSLKWSSRLSSTDGRITDFQLAANSTMTGTRVPVVLQVADFAYTGMGKSAKADLIEISLEMELQHFDNPAQVVISLTPPPVMGDIAITPAVIDGIPSQSMAPVLGEALKQTLDAFKPVLSLLDRTIPVGGTGSLNPTLVSHCYEGVPLRSAPKSAEDDVGIIDTPDTPDQLPSTSRLAIMYMTSAVTPGNPPPPPAPAEVVVKQANGGAAMCLSQPLFSSLVLLPAVAQSFYGHGNTPLTDAELANIRSQRLEVLAKGAGVKSRAGAPPIHFRSTEVDLSLLYSLAATGVVFPVALVPLLAAAGIAAIGEMITHKGKPALMAPTEIYLDSLSFSMAAERLDAAINVRALVSLAGIQIATITMTLNMSFAMTIAANGQIAFKQVGSSTHSDPNISAPSWLSGSKEGINILLTVVGVIASIVTDGLAAVLVGIMIGVMNAIVTVVIPMAFEQATKSGANAVVPGSVLGGIQGVTTSLSFLNGTKFVPERVAIDQSLILAGHLASPKPVTPSPRLRARAGSYSGE